MVPDGQLDPAASEVAVTISSLSPVSGLFTVTENVTVAVAPGARLPVQVSTGLAYDKAPDVVTASPL